MYARSNLLGDSGSGLLLLARQGHGVWLCADPLRVDLTRPYSTSRMRHRFLLEHRKQLGALGEATVEALNWARQAVIAVTPETPAVVALALMAEKGHFWRRRGQRQGPAYRQLLHLRPAVRCARCKGRVWCEILFRSFTVSMRSLLGQAKRREILWIELNDISSSLRFGVMPSCASHLRLPCA